MRSQPYPALACFVVACAVAFLLVGQTVAAGFSPIWRWSNPEPHGANIVDMSFAGGLVVQVGENGQIFTTEDLVSFIPRDSHTTNYLRAVTFFGGRIVITGERGTVLFSDDPFIFYLLDLATPDWLEGVAASSNLVVAVGDNGAIYSSTNGVVWSRQFPVTTTWLRSIDYGGTGVFVAVGERGTVLRSVTGTNAWAVTNIGVNVTNDLNKVAWIKDHFIVAADSGKAWKSVDGLVWQTVTNLAATNDLFGATGLVGSQALAGDLELRLNDSGTIWSNQLTAVTNAAPAWTYFCTLWDGLEYLVAGRTGMIVEGVKANGASAWAPPVSTIRQWLWNVARFPDYYLAVGDHGTILSSDNGADWNLELIPTNFLNSVFLGVGGRSNFFCVVGSQGSILYSSNALIWTGVSPPPTTNDLQGIVASSNLFVATGGNGRILTSIDGSNWLRQTSSVSAFLASVEVFPGGYVAVGDAGVILTSPNATNWTQRPSGTTNWLSQVRYLNGGLIAVGENGTILTSVDGVSWQPRNSGSTSWLNATERVGSNYFIFGTQGTVLTSTNLINWISTSMITKKSLYGAATFHGQLVSAGAEGVIVRTRILPDWTPITIQNFSRSSGQNIFLFSGNLDQHFTLDRSTVLSNWNATVPLEFLDGSGTLLYLENADLKSNEFYRGTLTWP